MRPTIVTERVFYIFSPPAPRTWPPGRKGRAVWRRFVTVTELATTSGIALACIIACSTLFAAADGDVSQMRPAARAYMPLGERSLAYIGALVLSDLLQDFVIWLLLVKEHFVPPAKKALTADLRRYLNNKVYPPIFASAESFGAFQRLT